MIKTLQLLRQHCQFLNMRQVVKTYVKKCLSCQQNKHGTHAQYDEIQYQELLELSWDEVTMNFITKLSKSTNLATRERYDLILVMIDKFIKYLHIIACKKKFIAKQLKYIVLDQLIRYHNILKGLTSDRDKLFTSNYWKTLILMLGTRLLMSIVYHLVTNDQIERINQSLEQYLRHYVNNIQNNWVSLLSMTQLTLNAKVLDITKITSFFVNFDKKSNLFDQEKKHLIAQSIIERIATLKKIHDNITTMQIRLTKYQNKKRKMAS